MSAPANNAFPAALSHPPAPAIRPGGWTRLADKALPLSAIAWFVVAIAGQLMFAAYVLTFYGRAAIAGHPENWNKVMPHGYVPGETLVNGVTASHLLLTLVALVGGAIQLTPQVRRLAPAVHRWNGRLYILAVGLLAVGGLTLMLTRGGGSVLQRIAIGINALLILSFAGMAWRHALARRFDIHRRWALRLFLVVAGVWFFRIGLMAWIVLNRGPVGFNPKTFEGPFLDVLTFAQYLLPLAVLELYWRVREGAGPRGRLVMATGLGGLTLLTAFGIVFASMILWLPKM